MQHKYHLRGQINILHREIITSKNYFPCLLLARGTPISLCSKGYKFLGLLCSEEKHAAWDNKYKDKRYSVGQADGTLTSADGIKFYVNTQWSIDGMHGIVKLAKAEGFKVTTL